MLPTLWQILLLIASTGFLLAGAVIALTAKPSPGAAKWNLLRWCAASGLACALGIVVWRSVERGQFQLVTDNFEALIWIAIFIVGFLTYIQSVKPVVGLDWFLLPAAVGLLLWATLLASPSYYRTYHPMVGHAWFWVHRASSYTGTAMFAIAAAGGAMYIRAASRLRRKLLSHNAGSLERIERIMVLGVTVGFALLTIGLITGIDVMIRNANPGSYTKVALACAAWLVYAVVLHAPINPRLRGRYAAILSILGFALLLGTLIAVEFVPGGH